MVSVKDKANNRKKLTPLSNIKTVNILLPSLPNSPNVWDAIADLPERRAVMKNTGTGPDIVVYPAPKLDLIKIELTVPYETITEEQYIIQELEVQ